MSTLTAREAKLHFGQLLQKSQHEPVEITKNGHPFSVMISKEQYQLFKAIEEKLEDDYWLAEAEKHVHDERIGVEASMEFLRKYKDSNLC